MRHLITADIHGQYDELMTALECARYDESADRLILLGDMVDRGAQSREVLACIAGLIARGRDLELLCGNHEDILQVFLGGKPAVLGGWLDACRGISLLRSYGYDPGRLHFAGDRVWADAEEIADGEGARAFLLSVMPASHLSVIEGARRFYTAVPHSLWETDVFCCHAGLMQKRKVDEIAQWLFAWGDPSWHRGRSTDFQPATAYGHFHLRSGPLVRYRRICLALETGVAVLVPEEELIVTSDRKHISLDRRQVLGG